MSFEDYINTKMPDAYNYYDALTEESIKKAGYESRKIEENVYLVENFITDEECDFLLQHARNATQEDWLGAYVEGIQDRSEARYGTRDLEKTKVEVTSNWNDKVLKIYNFPIASELSERLSKLFIENSGLYVRSFGVIQRQYEGIELREHYDQYVDVRMKWAAVIYINDDYTEGEFFFGEKGIEFRPPKKSLILFPATKEYLHGVKKVGAGPERYAVPSFVWDDPDAF